MNRFALTTGILAALSLVSFPAFAVSPAPAPQIINIGDRSSVSLDGTWKYLVDPYGIGYQSYHKEPLNRRDAFFADRSFDDNRKTLVEYSFDRAHAIAVPGDWNTQYEKLYYYEGHIWYRTKFEAKPEAGKRYFIYFGAVNYTAEVGVNGRRLAYHEGGFTPFNVEVTGVLRNGENSLVVLVDNTRQKDGIPTDNCDWWNYGGITRSVRLVEMPETFIRDYAVLLDPQIIGKVRKNRPERHRIYGHVQLDGPAAAGQTVSVSIPELKISVSAVADASGRANFEFQAAPQLWNPDSPKLYDVRISTPSDDTKDRIGFRYVGTSGTQITLNGKPVFMRGISIHEESIGKSHRVINADEARELIAVAKELNCNFLRLAHYPHNEEMVRLAEEAGLMVWSEIPAYWTISWTNRATFECAKNQLEEMITRDINRANVLIWSVANETPVSEERTVFLAKLIERAKEMDPTRLVSAAMEKYILAPGLFTVADPLAQFTDLISFNQYTGWYGRDLDEIDQTSWRFDVQKPVFISEFGAGALYGNHGPVDERFTEEYMAECYRRNIRMMTDRMPGLAGTTPWVLKDFRSPRRALVGIQDDFNRKGLVSDKGERKSAFFVVQEWYKSLAGK